MSHRVQGNDPLNPYQCKVYYCNATQNDDFPDDMQDCWYEYYIKGECHVGKGGYCAREDMQDIQDHVTRPKKHCLDHQAENKAIGARILQGLPPRRQRARRDHRQGVSGSNPPRGYEDQPQASSHHGGTSRHDEPPSGRRRRHDDEFDEPPSAPPSRRRRRHADEFGDDDGMDPGFGDTAPYPDPDPRRGRKYYGQQDIDPSGTLTDEEYLELLGPGDTFQDEIMETGKYQPRPRRRRDGEFDEY